MPAAVAIPAVIGAGTSIAGGIMGSRAAGKAAAQQAAAADQAVQGTNAAVANYDSTVNSANQNAAGMYNTVMAPIETYQGAGAQGVQSLAAGLAPGGELMKDFQFDPNSDPGFQFRMQQGQQALERSAAARGGALGGAAAKSLARYSQGLASQEYGAAFDRFQQNRGAKYNMLSGLANFGQNANAQGLQAGLGFGGMQNQNTMAGANAHMQGAAINADALTGKGNAQAAGTMGAANAWSQALGGVGQTANNVGQYYQYKDIFGKG